MAKDFASVDVAVVGGGLAGLTAATLLARAGKRVCLVERAPQLGGRAITLQKAGYALNLGPHALYRGGHARRILTALGVPLQGGRAATHGLAGLDERMFMLPSGAGSLLATRLLSPAQKLQAMRMLASLPLMDPRRLEGQTVRAWLQTLSPAVGQVIEMFLRLATYANAPDRQDAGAALRQLTMAVRSGTLYLDGGWQSLVDALRAAAEEAGVSIRTGSVTRVLHDARVQGIALASGETVSAPHVLLTLPPTASAALLEEREGAALRRWSERLIPVKAACLDLALRRLPRPKATLALGVDRPWYLSVHSASARLAPEGGAVIHAAWYRHPEGAEGGAELERALEDVLDRVQPGWRDAVVHRRFMPTLTVTHALDTPEGRPGVDAADLAGLWVAGDWVGSDGMLADAALASAERAVAQILAAPPSAIHPPSAPLS